MGIIVFVSGRNSTKVYVDNGYYHLYNRGVEKRPIFLDGQDYAVFQKYLSEYLLPRDDAALAAKLRDATLKRSQKDDIIKRLRLNNFSGEVTLLAYCLMPNHFHLFVKQTGANVINKFMNSLCGRYALYFNHRYERVGVLYQDVYKAVNVASEAQYLHLTRYIHRQAIAAGQPSSYPEYTSGRRAGWVHPEEVLSFFSTTQRGLSYQDFVEEWDPTGFPEQLSLEKE